MTETADPHPVDTRTDGTAAVRTAVWPCLGYRDAAAAMQFLTTAFGFVERARYSDGDVILHAEMTLPLGGGIMLGTRRSDDLGPGTGTVYVVIDNPDELYERATAAGVTIVRGLRDEDYGSRGFTCSDPEGVCWSFGTYAGSQ